ncbi:G-protein alpha subunit [Ceratobasidium sp. AG-Ba]|nr:G-protein alpha subunit [Ceratobasidium sp. AG-Ba]
MGSCMSNNTGDPEALRKHREVEKELKVHAKKQATQVKVLLLGSGDSGKSTVLKQMRVIHNDKFTPLEVEAYRQLVFNNIITGLKMLNEALPELDSSLWSQNATIMEVVRNTPELRDGEPYPEHLLEPLKSIWADPRVQEGWSRSNDVALPDNLQYFFSNLSRVFERGYTPTTQDIIRCRSQTTGINETVFRLRGHDLHLVDVGGQRSERRKWIHCFEDVTTILFLVSLSGYDQCLFEDTNANQMQDAMAIWDSICESEYFKTTNIILFLNKNDLFTEKVKTSPIRRYFPDYEGPEGDASEGRNYFRRRFLKLSNKSSHNSANAGRPAVRKREVYTHYTNATDTELLRVVMAAVEECVHSSPIFARLNYPKPASHNSLIISGLQYRYDNQQQHSRAYAISGTGKGADFGVVSWYSVQAHGGMSAQKRKNVKDAVNMTHIQGALVAVKPHVLDFQNTDFDALETGLARLNELLDHFLSTRAGKKRARSESVADELDREGVRLWNASIVLRGVLDLQADEPGPQKRVFASLRLAAFRLVEAGTSSPPTVESLVHLLQLASKAAAALSDCDDDRAQQVLMTAADYEVLVKELAAKDDDRNVQQKTESATVQYYCSRMDAAWKEGNEGVAYFMLEQATDERRLDDMPLTEVEEVIGRATQIGKGLLRKAWGNVAEPEAVADSKMGLNAVKWLQKAFQTLERVAGDEGNMNWAALREAVLRSLARAYFATSTAVESNLERAEATLDELFKLEHNVTCLSVGRSVEATDINLYWMRLAVFKRNKASVPQLLDTFRSILECLEFQEESVMSVLRELSPLADDRVSLAIDVANMFLVKALDSPSRVGHPFVHSIMMSLFLMIKPLHHSDACKAVERACLAIESRADFSMEKTKATACQLLLWRNGEASYKNKRWSEAADWFVLSASKTFQSTPGAQSRSTRKAALCYIQQGEYAQASMLVARCSQDEASTYYIKFLTAVHQGLEGEAVHAVESMVKAPDFDRKMLLLATQLAHETKQRTLLLAVLGAMLRTLRQGHQGLELEAETEGITIVRCSVRIILDLLQEPLAATNELVNSLMEYFRRALDLIGTVSAKGNLAIIAKDASWLWRTAYNAAVSGCRDWDELVVVELFDLAREVEFLMDAYSNTLRAEQDLDLRRCTLLAAFSAASGRLFVARRLGSSQDATVLYERLADDLPNFRRSALRALPDGVFDGDQPGYMVNLFLTFEIEVLSRLQRWERVQAVVEVAAAAECATSATLESIANLLWTEETCPTDVLYSALDFMLRSSLDSKHMSIDKFSRWLRAMCTILLARDKQQDRANALSFIEQAVEVIKENVDESGDQVYAHDEREWLLHIAFNTGVERFSVSDLDEAKRWIEAAIALARLVNNSGAASEKINALYQQVLARYGAQRS